MTSNSVVPQQKRPKLIVVVAFDRGEDGELFPAFGPADQQTEERAVRTAKGLVDKHVGVIAWSREAQPDIGEYGPPKTLFVSGDLPDMESFPNMEKLAFLLTFAFFFGIGGALVWLVVR